MAVKIFGRRGVVAAPAPAPAATGSLERRTELVELLSAAQSEGERLEKARAEAAVEFVRAKAAAETARVKLANAEQAAKDHVYKSGYAAQPLRAELSATAPAAIDEAITSLQDAIDENLQRQRHTKHGDKYSSNIPSIATHAEAARLAIGELQNLRLQALSDAEVAKQIKRITSKVPAANLEVK